MNGGETLQGQRAIISGGLGDIGRAIARELARRGADIALGDVLEPEKAEPMLQELEQMGRKARYDYADVSDAHAVRGWVAAVETDLGVPTLIIPNAAVVTLEGIRTLTPEQWRRELRINLDGAFHLAQAGAQRLLHHQLPGCIVFIGSWVGHAAQTHIPAYCVSKAGIRMLCRCLARDLAPHGILVNEVAPGNVDAGLSGRIYDATPGLRERDSRRIPVRKLIQPEEVAWQVANLCEPANQNMTGSVLVMDGGLSLLSYRKEEED
ncbi:MAG TPA: SDR family oxidoreductase [Chthonomonadaceae bacterium]|nr:SDR family oxidoreductase [Chthonomonadaceae bacterium]